MPRKIAKAKKPKKEKQTKNENTTEYFEGKLYWRIKTKIGPGEPEFSQPIEPGVKNLPSDLRFTLFRRFWNLFFLFWNRIIRIHNVEPFQDFLDHCKKWHENSNACFLCNGIFAQNSLLNDIKKSTWSQLFPFFAKYEIPPCVIGMTKNLHTVEVLFLDNQIIYNNL